MEGLVEDLERAHGTVGVAGEIREDLLHAGVLLDKASALCGRLDLHLGREDGRETGVARLHPRAGLCPCLPDGGRKAFVEDGLLCALDAAEHREEAPCATRPLADEVGLVRGTDEDYAPGKRLRPAAIGPSEFIDLTGDPSLHALDRALGHAVELGNLNDPLAPVLLARELDVAEVDHGVAEILVAHGEAPREGGLADASGTAQDGHVIGLAARAVDAGDALAEQDALDLRDVCVPLRAKVDIEERPYARDAVPGEGIEHGNERVIGVVLADDGQREQHELLLLERDDLLEEGEEPCVVAIAPPAFLRICIPGQGPSLEELVRETVVADVQGKRLELLDDLVDRRRGAALRGLRLGGVVVLLRAHQIASQEW